MWQRGRNVCGLFCGVGWVWNDCDGGRTKPCSKSLLQCHLIHQKSHLDWPRGERLWLAASIKARSKQKVCFFAWWEGASAFVNPCVLFNWCKSSCVFSSIFVKKIQLYKWQRVWTGLCGLLLSCCVHGDEPLFYIKDWEYINQLSAYELLMEHSVVWRYCSLDVHDCDLWNCHEHRIVFLV